MTASVGTENTTRTRREETDLQPGLAILEERPLVTFALFAYNQEKYICEAVEGAFAQTYEPLEIILSDDCSTDRTFQIMQEMAAGYKGPHTIRVRRNQQNVGNLAHVLLVASEARGELLIAAAGDDVSLPERTATLVRHFGSSDTLAGSSDDMIINEHGQDVEWDGERFRNRDYWHKKYPFWLHGATAAYRVSFLKTLPLPSDKIFYEDMVFSDILTALGKKTFRLHDRLIKYRYHSDNLSSRHRKNLTDAETSAMLRWQRASQAKAYCCRVARNLQHSNHVVIAKLYKRWLGEKMYYSLMTEWPRLAIWRKIQLLYFSFFYGDFFAAAIRLFGYSTFILIKQLRGISA